MDGSVYDEFGNYIGPDLHDEDDDAESTRSEENEPEDWEEREEPSASFDASPLLPSSSSPSTHRPPTSSSSLLDSIPPPPPPPPTSSALVPSYYPSSSQLYGPDTEVIVGDEDAQPIEQPLIAPLTRHRYALTEATLPATTWDWRFMAGMMDHPHLIRHVAVIGHLHHGKTSTLDMLVEHTHPPLTPTPSGRDHSTQPRYTDSRLDEQERGISLKSAPMSFILPTLSSKSHLLNLLDTPGHIDFSDEVTAALRLADAALLVVDAAEGVQVQTRRLLHHAAREGLRVLLLINKIDRLMLELKLPPADAYHKLQHIIEEVNGLLAAVNYPHPPLSPIANTVCFAAASFSYVFSLRSFAKMYADSHEGSGIDYRAFARKLWGNSYVGKDGRFGSVGGVGAVRSFIQFILDPLYKMHSHVLGSEGAELRGFLQEVGISVTATELKMDSPALLKLVLKRFFGGVEALTEMLVEHAPSPVAAAEAKVRHIYTGLMSTPLATAMLSCERQADAMLHVTKLYSRADSPIFDAFGRVFSGHLRVGDSVRVLGEAYSVDDEEDSSVRTITKIWIYNARYRVEVSGVGAGNWALFEGIDAPISKTATVTTCAAAAEVAIFRPLVFDTIAPMKVAIEPWNPSELPKMLEGLRRVDKSYPLSQTRVEESGEHTLMGTGELYLDCVLYDLRKVFSDIEVRVSDPVVRFCETVIDTTQLECFGTSGNRANRISMLAEPLDPHIADDIEHGRLTLGGGGELQEKTRQRLEREYGWDVLQSRSIWAFGPDDQGPNILVDETLPAEVSPRRAHTHTHAEGGGVGIRGRALMIGSKSISSNGRPRTCEDIHMTTD